MNTRLVGSRFSRGLGRSARAKFAAGGSVVCLISLALAVVGPHPAVANPPLPPSTKIPVTSSIGVPDRGDTYRAIDGDLSTDTYTTPSNNLVNPSYLEFGFDSTAVNRIRLYKDNYVGPHDLIIQYTTDTSPDLTSRNWTNVSGLVNGFAGTELITATAVNSDGTVTAEATNSEGDTGTGWASLTFDTVTATGIRIAFFQGNPCCNHYHVFEFEAHDVTWPLDHLVLTPASATIGAGGSQSYQAEGFDSFGNDVGDVTASTTFDVDGSTAACTGAVCSSAVGDHTVTGTDGTVTGTATLHVTQTCSAPVVVASTATVTCSPGDGSWTPPTAVNSATFTLDGAAGGGGSNIGLGAAGGHTSATAAVSSATTYQVAVGAQGGTGTGAAAGSGGSPGGAGGNCFNEPPDTTCAPAGGGGGGASVVFAGGDITTTSAWILAAGGGGGGGNGSGSNGGAGGGATGADGSGPSGGAGGGQSGGGSGNALNGSAGGFAAGGGGGGGLFGGAGSGNGDGGGGGSGFVKSDQRIVGTTAQGTNTGAGLVTITYAVPQPCSAAVVVGATSTVTCPEGTDFWAPPSGVTSVSVNVEAAHGGAAANTSATGGSGATATAFLSVASANTYTVLVGGQGGTGDSSTAGSAGFNGGGGGGDLGGGGGGGGSEIDLGLSRIVVAGGGGGAGGRCCGLSGSGGDGGTTGNPGQNGSDATGGGGGMSGSGGGFGAGTAGNGQPGGFGTGGAGGAGQALATGGGGGGGGSYGGGGGGGGASIGGAGGGGGSGFILTDPTVTEPTMTTGNGPSGDGTVTISWVDADLALAQPADVTTTATGSGGAMVTFPTPAVTDEDASQPVAGCSPTSGSLFPIGQTTVTCSVTDNDDAPATASKTFTVTVTDTDLGLAQPPDITTLATGPSGARVTFSTPAVTDEDAPRPVAGCSPTSGSTFAIGHTTVSCTVTDNDDTTSPVTKTLKVTVNKRPTTTKLAASTTHPAFGTAVTFTATVTKNASSALSPTGTVSFYLDGSATAVATVNLSGGSAHFSTAGLGAGSHTVVATYSGDGTFATSSGSKGVTVGTTTTITGSHPGSITVASGTTVLLSHATVGSVVVQAGGAVDIESSTIASLSANGASGVRLCGSTVTGGVTVGGSSGFVLIGDSGDDACPVNSIGGGLTLQHNTHGLEAIGNHVAGAISVSGNSGAGAFPEDSAPEVSGNGP